MTKSLDIPRHTYRGTFVLSLRDKHYTFVMTAREEGVTGWTPRRVPGVKG